MSKYSSHQHYLNIHHRSVAVRTGSDGNTIEVSASPGHFLKLNSRDTNAYRAN